MKESITSLIPVSNSADLMYSLQIGAGLVSPFATCEETALLDILNSLASRKIMSCNAIGNLERGVVQSCVTRGGERSRSCVT